MLNLKGKTLLFAASAVFFASTTQAAPPVQAMTVECNWGKLTMEAIHDEDLDFDQGEHSSDPAGDGPGGADQPRKGLGNVVEQGQLEYTCELIKNLLYP